MKENAKKTLFFLYVKPTKPYFFASIELLKAIVSDLSPSGHRSLITLLVKRGWVSGETLLGETKYRITTAGINALKTALPVFNNSYLHWQGTWAAMVFKEAPPGDKQFRYLRTLLVKYQSVPLARGVYLYPDVFPSQIMTEVENRYSKAVSVFQIGTWISDDERQIAIQHYGLSDLLQTYSGISSEVKRLINRKNPDKDLNHQEKQQLSSLFDRLYEMIGEDTGLLTYYFPQVESGLSVLAQIQDFCRQNAS